MAVIEQWMIYGANGYTGKLVATKAQQRGQQPILAGRSREQILDLAAELDLPHQVFALDHIQAIKAELKDVGLVLNCAGPFSQTAERLRQACVETGVHYIDITGEIDILASSYALDAQARESGSVIISGVGFDVVPTDVLSALLKRAMPDATHLELAFAGGGGVSPGTAKTMVEMLPEKGQIRRDGQIIQVPLAYECKDIPFADQTRHCMTIPWGDVATAYYTTEIPNIQVYTAVEPAQAKAMWRMNYITFLIKWGWVQKLIKKMITDKVPGPTDEQRAEGFIQLWGKASKPSESVSITMATPDGYDFTVSAALLFVDNLLAHKILPGAYTPTQALPLECFTEMEGVSIQF